MRKGCRVLWTSSTRPRHLALNSETGISRMTTSLTIVNKMVNSGWLASRFGLLYLFNQRRNDIKQITHYRIVGDFENRRLGVFVHSHNCLRTLHADYVLNRAADAQGKIKLRRNRLAR